MHYAIADVAAFVSPGDAVDAEAHRRGETLYGADSKVPLHPPVLSEGAASLLPDQVRPALLWTVRLDATGERTDVRVERALVRSREQLDYETVQAAIDAGTAAEPLQLLKEVGELRLRLEAARGGVALPLPEQEVEIDGDDWRLEFRSLVPAEEWNAQISLLTGIAAASLMVGARVGLLRTLPPPDPATYGGCSARPARSASTGPTGRRTRSSSARSIPPSPGTPRWSSPAPACCGGAGTPRSTARCPSRPGTRRWPRSTPTSPRHCAGSATGTPARCASRSVPGPRCPTGSGSGCRTCRRRCASPAPAPGATSGQWSTWSRPASCTTGWGRRSTRWSSTSPRTAAAGAAWSPSRRTA